jgi:hypothetical protein
MNFVDVHVLFGKDRNLITTPCKKNNSIAASSKLCKIIEHPLSSNKSLAIEKAYSQ